MYNLITFGMLVFCVFDWKFGFVNDFHKQFNFLGFLSLMVNYLLIILTRTRVITDPVPMFFVFNSGLFLVTAMVFSSGIKHRIFD